ncbi:MULTISPECIES: iron uptake porin [Nostoc]|uniref:Iron uptake porin n=2 Tax=Nostoc TaxID=1177 RepID=A0ABR8I5W6_9NOSO|nr:MULTISPECIES: iron uptake porin [Nostoc]MBD2561177.1 iron uptake porin [Nostoc linckia FACHB-391]MBD2645940.1 iron uptake porin [Nostoc foliaceum FACHB-393]
MNKIGEFLILTSSLTVTISCINTPIFAQANQRQTPLADISQLTSVSQLSDVQPTDWAFQALQSLIERYACIAGYPNGTYRGERAMTRYEFAASLNTCLTKVQELIATTNNSLATKEDLDLIQKLQSEFSSELVTLRSRVDALESTNSELKANQFSPTTKLEAEAILTVANIFGENVTDSDDNQNNNAQLDTNLIFAQRVRLNFLTSFTGKDELNLRLESGNIPEFDDSTTGTTMTRLGFDEDTGNDIGLDEVYYSFPIGDKIKTTIAITEMELNDIAEPINPLASSGSGAVSRFGRYNPILRSMDGTGLGINYQLNQRTHLAVAYMANNAAVPTENNGLFNGNFAALGHLYFRPVDNLGITFTYLHGYYAGGGESGVNLTGSTGSLTARSPFGNVATIANSFGLETSWQINPKFILSGWVGYTKSESQVTNDDADIFNYAVSLALPDFGGEGNLAGLVMGMPPKVTSSSLIADRDTSLHIEGFYRFQVTDNISITPGLFLITNPEHNANNESIFVGAIRTHFKF